MKPNIYFDIEANVVSDDTGMNPLFMRSRILSILHAFFRAKPHSYALALPSGRMGLLRVFATERSELDDLVDGLRENGWIRDYARIGYPSATPKNYTGPWTAFVRYRVPSLRQDRDVGAKHGLLRQRRIRRAAEERMDYFTLRSASNGERFSLLIRRVPGEAPGRKECLPNSYGFCGSDNMFCVPDLP